MRACLVFLCLLAVTVGLSIKGKGHGKHHRLHKTSNTVKEKDMITEEADNPQTVPTSLPFEGSSREQEDEELQSEDNVNANKETEKVAKSTAVLLSDEDLVEILRKEAEEEEKEAEEEEAEEEEKTSDDMLETEEISEAKDEEEVKLDNDAAAVMMGKEMEVERTSLREKSVDQIVDKEELGALLNDDGSTESEIPVDLDYAADSGIFQHIEISSGKKETQTDDTQPLFRTDVTGKGASEKGLPMITEDSEPNTKNREAADSNGMPVQDPSAESKGIIVDENEPDEDVDPKDTRSGSEPESESTRARKEEMKSKNISGSLPKGKKRKQKKNQREGKHAPQSEETLSGQEHGQQDPQESEGSNTDNRVPKAKRRRAGKWGPVVGMNPVQIRATVDLYPGSRPSLAGGVHRSEASADPCEKFPCKRGKVCKLLTDNKPGCVCQEPAECRPGVNEYDHVCGTDNKTYDTSCELFATKCNLEGSKRGHRLHLDYTGPCKLIPECVDTELVQFPLRMRDWLKNVLLQLYDHDSMSPGFLTAKQRFRVKKIFENERRLHAGDHSVELLAQDFEKNYNMYIYPVHWQFAQLDQHPSDRALSHSELAPLRVPLVPMEHCTSRFFQECDTDKDKQLSFKEWTSCFGIKKEDMDVNQLF
ncbi:SPARC-like protein 1 [Brachionichthys hirsutus]|uniref:SPARC-like protein 1 n=1 Tax=Brachionichthys hirsutus TaxID=412623 RepID=UPI003604FAAB